MDEEGFLINEFLEYLDKFPRWDRTKYYCPSFRLYTCEDDRLWHGIEQSQIKETHRHNRTEHSKMTSSDKRACISVSSRIQMSQVKGKLGDAIRRCKGLVGFRSKKDGLEIWKLSPLASISRKEPLTEPNPAIRKAWKVGSESHHREIFAWLWNLFTWTPVTVTKLVLTANEAGDGRERPLSTAHVIPSRLIL